MTDLIDKIVEGGGIWACMACYLIVTQGKRLSTLEEFVRTTVVPLLEVMKDVKEELEDANKNRRNKD